MTQKQHFGKIKRKTKNKWKCFSHMEASYKKESRESKGIGKKAEMGKREQDSQAAGDKE